MTTSQQLIDQNLQGIWQLEWMKDKVVDSIFFPKGAPRLEFKPQERMVIGNTGCNYMSAELTVGDNGSLTLHNIIATELFCSGVPEEDFLAFLSRTNFYKCEGLKLTLMADNNPVLRFKKVYE